MDSVLYREDIECYVTDNDEEYEVQTSFGVSLKFKVFPFTYKEYEYRMEFEEFPHGLLVTNVLQHEKDPQEIEKFNDRTYHLSFGSGGVGDCELTISITVDDKVLIIEDLTYSVMFPSMEKLKFQRDGDEILYKLKLGFSTPIVIPAILTTSMHSNQRYYTFEIDEDDQPKNILINGKCDGFSYKIYEKGITGDCNPPINLNFSIRTIKPTMKINAAPDVEPAKAFPVTHFYDKYADVIFKAKNNLEVYSYRCILAPHSLVLKSIFDENSKTPVKIKVPHFKASIISLAISICHGNNEGINGHEKELLKFAKEYIMPILKKVCEASMLQSLDVKNSCDYILLAYIHGLESLKAKSKEFIRKNKKKIGINDLKFLPQYILFDLFVDSTD